MSYPCSQFDELGLKVQRAQHDLERVRGTGTVGGVTVEVDAQNKLLSVSIGGGDLVIAAYQAALNDKQPKVDAAVRELMADPRAEAISTFVQANSNASAPVQQRPAEIRQTTSLSSADAFDDDDYFEQLRRNPLARRD